MRTAEAFPDVLVVGAGVIGLATAHELSCRGLRVCVVEQRRVGPGGASWAAGGILAPMSPLQVGAELLPLLQDSLAVYADWCAQLREESGIDPEYTLSGMAVMPPADQGAWRSWAESCGLDVCAGRREHFFGGKAESLLDLPGVAQVRSPRLLRVLAAAVRARGGEIIEDEPVLAIEDSGVLTSRRRLRAGLVVVAAGAWSAGLDSEAGVEPLKGEMLLFDTQAEAPQRILLHPEVYIIPRRDGRLVVGSTLERAGFDSSPTASGRTRILGALEKLAPQLADCEPIAHWAGLRPAPLEGTMPRIEWSVTRKHTLLSCGHHRMGITLAPGSARRIAAMALRGR